MPRLVTAFSNSTVKRLRSLRDKKSRREEGLFLAEGLRIITEARDSGRLPEIIMFSAEGAKHALAAEIIDATEAAGGEAIETTADILSKASGKENPQMLVAAYRQPTTSLVDVDRASAPLWFVAQALRDPGNIGTILRTGDAVGAGGLILVDDSADPYSVEAVRASMGAIFTQQVAGCFIIRRQPLLFVADQQEAWLFVGDLEIILSRLEAGSDQLSRSRAKPGDEFVPTGDRHGLGEDGSHRRSDGLHRIGVGAVVDQDQPAGRRGIAGAEDRSDIAWIAQGLGDDPQW